MSVVRAEAQTVGSRVGGASRCASCRHRVGGASCGTSSSLSPGRVACVGRDMAALVEPLGLERGKRSGGSSPASKLSGPRQSDAGDRRSQGGRGAACGRGRVWGGAHQQHPAWGWGPGDRRGASIASSLTSIALPAAFAVLTAFCRRVPGRGAAGAAATQRRAAPAEAAGPAAGPAEPFLFCHPRGEHLGTV